MRSQPRSAVLWIEHMNSIGLGRHSGIGIPRDKLTLAQNIAGLRSTDDS